MANEDNSGARHKLSAKMGVEAQDEDDLVARFGDDLADNGLFVRHDRPPAVDAMVLVEFGRAGQPPFCQVVGRVVHSRPATQTGEVTAGMRLQLVELDATAERAAARARTKLAGSAPPPAHAADADKERAQFRTFSLGKAEQRAMLSLGGPVIGIDLGTVNTCVAIMDQGRPRVISSPEGYETVPSVVYVGQGDQVTVGRKALEKMVLEPTRCIHGSKRFMGRPFASREVRSLGHFFNYRLVPSPSGRTAAQVDDRILPLEEVAGIILRTVRQMASTDLGRDIGRAVVTVPAYFGETQRQAVRDAGKLAGLFVERIINEPTAAAVAYGFGRSLQQTILVYDLGGGTFDASLLRINHDSLEVLATDGDPFLGGQDFDDRMTEYVLMAFERSHQVKLREDMVAVQRLRFAAQQVKHQLSEADVASLDVPYIGRNAQGPVDLHLPFERRLLEDLTRDLVDRTLSIVETVLKDAKVKSSELDDVLLVGGQSRSPHVRRALVERFGRKPSSAVHPDQAVAIGAAIVADAMQKNIAVRLVDVLPASIRMGVAEGRTAVLLPKGTRLPASKMFEVAAPVAGRELKVVLCRGEETALAQNTLLGMLRVAGEASGAPPGKLHLTVQVSAEGILSVHTRLPSGAEQELEVSLT